MRSLLRDMPAGVPADCLLARLKGRRSFLVRDWNRLLNARQPPATLPAAPWRAGRSGGEGWTVQALQQEYRWVFLRMDEQLRRAAAPFFWLAELRTLAVCLRLLSVGGAEFSRLLANSLLAPAVTDLLRSADGPGSAVYGLAALLAEQDPRFARLPEIHRTGGSGALETALHDLSLRSLVTCASLHPQMRRYCLLLIDCRNLTAVAKRLRWRLVTLPPLLDGGTLATARLAELFGRRDSAGLLRLAMRLGGETPYGETDDLERVLHEARQRFMGRLAREGDAVGVILDYLWRCGTEAANIALLERLETAGGDAVAGELRR